MFKYLPLVFALLVHGCHLSHAQTFASDTIRFGNGSASTNKDIIFNKGANSQRIRANNTTGRLQYTNDGTNFLDIGSGSGGQGINLLQNPDFEAGTLPWATSGGGTYALATSGTNLLFGLASGTFDAGAANHILQSEAVTIPEGLGGANCLARVFYKGGDSNLELRAVDGSSNVLAAVTLRAQTLTTRAEVNFICPAAGQTMRLQVRATADAALIAIDNAKLGDADNLSQVSQATFAGGMEQAGAANCAYNENTSTAFNNFVTLGVAASCASAWTNQGAITNLGPTRHEAVYNNMPPGSYQIVVNAFIRGTANGTCNYRLFDGTTGYQPQATGVAATGGVGVTTLVYHVPYSTSASRTFTIQAGDDTANTCGIANDIAGLNLSWKFYRFPTQAEQAVRLDQTNYDWIDGGPITIGATTTAPTKGTVSRDRVFYKREGQNLLVRYEYNQTVAGAAGSGDYLFGIPAASGCTIDTARIGTSTTVGANSVVNNTVAVGSATAGLSSVAGVGTVSVFSNTQLRILIRDNVGIQSAASGFYGLNNATVSYAAQASVPCVGWQENRGAPLLVGSVTSNSGGAERLERATVVNTGSACNVLTESGDWLAATGTRNAAGDCTWTINAGIFAADPTCQVTPITTCREASFQAAPTTTTVRTFTSISNGTGTDCTAHLSCQGPRVLP